MSQQFPEREAARHTLDLEERRLHALTTHEEAVLVDATSGKVIWRRVGAAASVEFSFDDRAVMQGNVLTHNCFDNRCVRHLHPDLHHEAV